MKIRKTKKRYKTMFLAPAYCTKVKFKKIGTLIKNTVRCVCYIRSTQVVS